MTSSDNDPEVTGEDGTEELEQQSIPKWVPMLIGLVLVGLGALAVYTGIRYRSNPLAEAPRTGDRQQRVSKTSAPGEPQPGGSFVFPGEGGENVPAANEPVTGNARAVVTGGATGVNAVVRMWARRGMIVVSEPPDAMVSVNGMPVGEAAQFDTTDEIYDFAEPGSYNVRVSAAGHLDRTYVVTSSNEAKDDVAVIRVKLERTR